MIQKLSNQELELNLKRLVANERKILHLILEHILEVDSRKLYLEKAYPSLFEYLVQELGYSGAGAMRRISAARLMKQVPVVSEKIQNGDLNLSQISELSRAIKEKEKSGGVVSTLQKSELVKTIAGKTLSESQKNIAQVLDLDLKAPEKTLVQKDESVHLQITLTQEQYEKLLMCRDLAAHTLLSEKNDTSLAGVIEFLSEAFLESKKMNLKAKHPSHLAKAAEHPVDSRLCQTTTTPEPETSQKSKSHSIHQQQEANLPHNHPQESPISLELQQKTKPHHPNPSGQKPANKTLTPKTRRTVLQRDGCCQYKDPSTGKICGATFNLETDHRRQSRWAGGTHDLDNLQTLCRAHNGYKYRREMGLRFV